MRNVLITGTPRSGTTLLCSLLNKLPDTVALHEPMNVWEFPNCRDAAAIADVIEGFCNETRKSLLEHGVAVRGVQDQFSIGSAFGGKERGTRELVAVGFALASPRQRLIHSAHRMVDLGRDDVGTIWQSRLTLVDLEEQPWLGQSLNQRPARPWSCQPPMVRSERRLHQALPTERANTPSFRGSLSSERCGKL